MTTFARHRVLFFFLVFFLVVSGTYLLVLFSRGYRFDFGKKKIKPTGLLVMSSNPIGAEVFVNDKLTTATNNAVNLEPGQYNIKIRKEGYLFWQKNLLIEKELVTQADALLFQKLPDLRPITFNGIENPLSCPESSKILYTIPLPDLKNKISTISAALSQNAGVWVIDLNDSPFGIGKSPKQIAKSERSFDFSKATIFWSPDCRQVITDFSPSAKYLLNTDQFNSIQSLTNIVDRLPEINTLWQKEVQTKFEAKFKKIPEKLQPILKNNTANLTFSLDGKKVMYVATASAQIPENIISPVPAVSSQKESRQLQADKLYVYDIKEDKNFEITHFSIPSPTPTVKSNTTKNKALNSTPDFYSFTLPTVPQWFPSSRHLIWINNSEGGDKIVVCEYDNTNYMEIYSGPFIKPYVFTSAGQNKLVILTKINPDQEEKPNLFEVSLR